MSAGSEDCPSPAGEPRPLHATDGALSSAASGFGVPGEMRSRHGRRVRAGSASGSARRSARRSGRGGSGTRRRRGPGRIRSGTVGALVVATLAVICGGLVLALLLRSQGYDAAADRLPRPSSTVPSAAGPVIAVISDESALDAASGVTGAERWPRLLARSTGARVVILAAAGAGYAARGATGEDFRDAARRVPVNASVVLVVGGAGDRSQSRIRAARAMTETFSAVRRRVPSASVLAVGPFFAPSAASVQDIAMVQRTLRSAGEIADVEVVDPFTAGWSLEVRSATELGVQDERTVGRALDAAVRAALR